MAPRRIHAQPKGGDPPGEMSNAFGSACWWSYLTAWLCVLASCRQVATLVWVVLFRSATDLGPFSRRPSSNTVLSPRLVPSATVSRPAHTLLHRWCITVSLAHGIGDEISILKGRRIVIKSSTVRRRLMPFVTGRMSCKSKISTRSA